MARYIDADNFRKTMTKRFGCIPCLTDYSEASRNDIPIDDALSLAPTADVVPRAEVERLKDKYEIVFQPKEMIKSNTKTEVAREIFEEIEENYADFLFDGYRNIVVLTEKDFNGLKKKYTEGQK